MHAVVCFFTASLSSLFAASHSLSPKVESAETYAETFTVVADLQDGSYVHAQLAITNIGPGDHQAACRFMIKRQGSKALARSETFDRSKWFVQTKPNPALVVGPCRLSAARTTDLDISLGDDTLLISLDREPSAVVPPGHPIKVKSSFYESSVLVPWAAATVTWSHEGRDQVLSGAGYVDHSRSTTLPDQLAKTWVRFRSLLGPCQTLLLVRALPSQNVTTGYLWRRGNEKPRALKAPKLAPVSPDAHRVTINVQEGQETFAITSHAALYRHAPLEELGVLGRMVGSLVGNAVTNTFRARLADGSPCGAIEGILEVTHVN